MGKPMPLIRLAAAAAATLILAGCVNPQAQRPAGDLPQTVTLRNSQTGSSTTVKGATVALVAALAELSRRNYAGAVRLTSQAIRSGQLSGHELSTAHAVRGDAYYLAGDAAKARDDWRTAVEMDAQNAMALRGMAIISHMQRKIPESMQYMQRAINASPDNAHLYLTRGLLRVQDRRELALAHADFDKAVSLKPDLASAYFYRGLVSHLNGRYAQAKVDYERALEINPAESRARQALGLLEQRRAPADNLAPRSRPNEVIQF
jgi:tetratricopeptide (TPR) repeat protein